MWPKRRRRPGPPRSYNEGDVPNPQSVYGASKLGGELECPPGSTIVRTSWVCGAHGKNMVKTAMRLADGDGELRFVADQHGAARGSLVLEHRPGTFHLTNQGATTWWGFVRAVLEAVGADPEGGHPDTTE